ncbi:magnesium transporter [Alkalilimnicola ehrlichii]|uniref:magnesium transporter n=1 Tax=Alkalilimnicola ehrlichii TaxID=351052 RepID=UPI0021638C8B|nr:CBS domain-containing protein [Alkalilimnicola ehrlichii]
MQIATFADAVRETLAQKDAATLRELLEDTHPADLALCVSELGSHDTWRVLSALSPDKRAAVFGYLPANEQVELADSLNRRHLAEIFQHMSADERADLFNRLNTEQQQTLLPGLAQAERDDIRKLAGYETGSAGAIMTSDYATLAPELTAWQAIQRLRSEAPDKETIYQAYVIDRDRQILGTVSLRDLIVAPNSAKVSDLMVEGVIYAHVEDPQEEVAGLISKYDLLALPIVDSKQRLVGIVTYDDAMDVAEEEATEDFHRHGTVGKLDTSVRDASIPLLYQKRVFGLSSSFSAIFSPEPASPISKTPLPPTSRSSSFCPCSSTPGATPALRPPRSWYEHLQPATFRCATGAECSAASSAWQHY